MDRLISMSRFDESEKSELCTCEKCGNTFLLEELSHSIGDKEFCDVTCAEDYVIDNIGTYIYKLLD